MMTHDDRGEGGVKNCQNGGDVICGWPLTKLPMYFFPMYYRLPKVQPQLTKVFNL